MTIRRAPKRVRKPPQPPRVEPLTLLEGVLAAFNTNSVPRYRTALTSLLGEGPLLVDVFVYRALEHWRDEAIVRLRGEFVALFQSIAKHDRAGADSNGIGTVSAMAFKPQSTRAHTAVLASGQIRDIVVVQALIALHLVGLKNLRTCRASDCQMPFVTRWGKEHCSVRCQKRTERRRNREAARKQPRKRRHGKHGAA